MSNLWQTEGGGAGGETDASKKVTKISQRAAKNEIRDNSAVNIFVGPNTEFAQR